MAKLNKSLAAKTAAVILSYIAVVLAVLSVIGVEIIAKEGFYNSDKNSSIEEVMADKLEIEINRISYRYFNKVDFNNSIEEKYKYTNVYYKITDYDGNILLSNLESTDYLAKIESRECRIIDNIDEGSKEFKEKAENDEIENYSIYVSVYLPKEMKYNDTYSRNFALLNFLYNSRYTAIVIGIVSAILFVVLICFLIASAGHKKELQNVYENFIDRIPFDIYTVIIGILAVISVCILDEFIYTYDTLEIMVFSIVLSIDYFIGLSYILSVATRIKTKRLFKNTLIFRFFKWLFSGIGYIFKNFSMIKKTVLILFIYGVFELIILMCGLYSPVFNVFTRFFIYLAISFVALFTVITIKKLKTGADEISRGNLEYKIDTTKMVGDFKEFGNSINNINYGLQNAVNEKMKSERFKTELITNVSHDIKTPLTSIINYVDLLEKEDIDNEKANEYLEVLERQSSRLKKLIEDLVEASKASTGNISVNLTKCDVGVLLSQALGEFEDKFKKISIEPILNIPEKPLEIMADGRHLWRVFDNLLNNICKYTQSNTRVYLDVKRVGSRAVITFRNISKTQLNISSEELMERFVRGDSSRNTEGSGLGLNIAKSLVELQNGFLGLTVDGDLFKVTVSFEALN